MSKDNGNNKKRYLSVRLDEFESESDEVRLQQINECVDTLNKMSKNISKKSVTDEVSEYIVTDSNNKPAMFTRPRYEKRRRISSNNQNQESPFTATGIFGKPVIKPKDDEASCKPNSPQEYVPKIYVTFVGGLIELTINYFTTVIQASEFHTCNNYNNTIEISFKGCGFNKFIDWLNGIGVSHPDEYINIRKHYIVNDNKVTIYSDIDKVPKIPEYVQRLQDIINNGQTDYVYIKVTGGASWSIQVISHKNDSDTLSCEFITISEDEYNKICEDVSSNYKYLTINDVLPVSVENNKIVYHI